MKFFTEFAYKTFSNKRYLLGGQPIDSHTSFKSVNNFYSYFQQFLTYVAKVLYIWSPGNAVSHEIRCCEIYTLLKGVN